VLNGEFGAALTVRTSGVFESFCEGDVLFSVGAGGWCDDDILGQVLRLIMCVISGAGRFGLVCPGLTSNATASNTSANPFLDGSLENRLELLSSALTTRPGWVDGAYWKFSTIVMELAKTS
jgi:hypothetical protein